MNNIKEMQEVMAHQSELISRQHYVIESLKKQVEALSESVRWYESEKGYEESMERMQRAVEDEREISRKMLNALCEVRSELKKVKG